MRTSLLAALVLLIFHFEIQAQDIDIKPLIAALKTSDTSQTRKYYEVWNYLSKQDSATRQHVFKQMDEYLANHPGNRLQVRIMLLEEPWWKVYMTAKPGNDNGISFLNKAVRLATIEADEQLLSEVYFTYAEHCTRLSLREEYLLYSTKSLAIQQKIGSEHFPYFVASLFNMCKALYATNDFKQSLYYGLLAQKFYYKDDIYTLDLVAADYRKLGMYDSSIFYYKRIIDLVKADPQSSEHYPAKDKWLIIANGDIGINLSLEKKYAEALPLLEEYAQRSKTEVDPFNVGLSNNALANVYFLQNKYEQAIECWKTAYHSAIFPEVCLENANEATAGLAKAYMLTGRSDSALKYEKLNRVYADTLTAFVSRSNLRTTQAKVNFDEMKSDLDQAHTTVKQQRLVRNFILGGIALLTVIALLLYNRKIWQDKYRTAQLERKRQVAEMETKKAKEQVTAFAQQLIDKDDLITRLTDQLQSETEQTQEQNRATQESLLQYSLITDAEWDKFREEFIHAYPKFFSTLHKEIGKLTPAEERLSALISLNLNNQQIGNMLGIGKESVARYKRGLKTRLVLPNNEAVEAHLKELLS